MGQGKAAAAPPAPPLEQLPVGELARKLAESQQMIARFSRENERLANQNEQLTGSKQVVANDYKGSPCCREYHFFRSPLFRTNSPRQRRELPLSSL